MNYPLQLPDSYDDEIKKYKGNVSINQFILTCVAEKLSALKTGDYLEKRAGQGSREHGLAMLDRVADISPEEKDAL